MTMKLGIVFYLIMAMLVVLAIYPLAMGMLWTWAWLRERRRLSGIWIDRVHDRKTPKMIVLDMDSSESPTHGDQEGYPRRRSEDHEAGPRPAT